MLRSVLLSAAFLPALTSFAQAGDCVGDALRTGLCVPGETRGLEKKAEEETMTDAEINALPRDQRRTKIMEGFTCHRFIAGQAGYIKYMKDGEGRVGHHEGYNSFTWSIENDQLCYRGYNFQDECHDLPKRDLQNERAWLIGALSKNCHG